jgi:hypothetical protein
LRIFDGFVATYMGDGEMVREDGGAEGRTPRRPEAIRSRWSSACRSASPVREARLAYDMRRVNSAAARSGPPIEHERGRSRSGSHGGAGSGTDGRSGSRASLYGLASQSGMAGMTPLGGRQSLDSDAPLPELGMPLLRDEDQRVCCGMADFCENQQQRRICGSRPLSGCILPARPNFPSLRTARRVLMYKNFLQVGVRWRCLWSVLLSLF